ncbi:jg22612 [Pararge aegeria aegeria]|uniref:Jg22612 protein n=1 Tax=Pararge aegeria aegeria TaxID=348720 RepID=A0A8S4SJR3_9NEOP|nr:jg22612 [Pararge aegeria aegeria]
MIRGKPSPIKKSGTIKGMLGNSSYKVSPSTLGTGVKPNVHVTAPATTLQPGTQECSLAAEIRTAAALPRTSYHKKLCHAITIKSSDRSRRYFAKIHDIL